MLRRFRQVDVFTESPYVGNPVAVVLDGDGLDDDAMRQVRPLDEPLRDDVRAAADAARRRLPGPDLHARPTSCRSPGTRRWARATPGCEAGGRPRRRRRRAGVRRRTRAESAGPPAAWPSPPRRCCAPVPSTTTSSTRWRPPSASTAPPSSPPSGSTTARAGWPCCSTSVDAVAGRPSRMASSTSRRSGSSALHPPARRAAIEVRAFFPKDGDVAEDPVTGQPQRLRRPVAARSAAASTAPYVARQGTVARAGRAGPRHRSTTTARSGSAAARSRASRAPSTPDSSVLVARVADGQFGWNRCHCSGARRIRYSSSWARAWVTRGDVLAQLALRARCGSGGRTTPWWPLTWRVK